MMTKLGLSRATGTSGWIAAAGALMVLCFGAADPASAQECISKGAKDAIAACPGGKLVQSAGKKPQVSFKSAPTGISLKKRDDQTKPNNPTASMNAAQRDERRNRLAARSRQLLVTELQNHMNEIGIDVERVQLRRLAYAPEIAADMLRRQQAEAVVAARFRIVEGAVSMVEQALDQLSEKKIVNLDEERKAAMVSNLLVVLCSEHGTQPVVNAGSLYQ